MSQTETPDTLHHIKLCAEALEAKKASEIQVLDVSGKSSITDYLVVASGMAEPHLKALRNDLEKTCKDNGINVIGADRETTTGWLVFDAFDFMIHLFTDEQRAFYGLETLWKDAVPVELA